MLYPRGFAVLFTGDFDAGCIEVSVCQQIDQAGDPVKVRHFRFDHYQPLFFSLVRLRSVVLYIGDDVNHLCRFRNPVPASIYLLIVIDYLNSPKHRGQ